MIKVWIPPISVVFLAIALAWSFLAHDSMCGESGDVIDLIIRPEQEVYAPGDSIRMELCLTNVGGDSINLFHPGPINNMLPGYGLSLACHVTRPDGEKFEIVPARLVEVATFQPPEAEDFNLLSPGDEITIPILFAAIRWLGEDSGNAWYGYRGTRGDKMISMLAVIQDVFNVQGEYELEFRYSNSTDYFLIPDEEGKYFVASYVEDCWTGSLADTIVLTVADTKDEPGVHQDDGRDAID